MKKTIFLIIASVSFLFSCKQNSTNITKAEEDLNSLVEDIVGSMGMIVETPKGAPIIWRSKIDDSVNFIESRYYKIDDSTYRLNVSHGSLSKDSSLKQIRNVTIYRYFKKNQDGSNTLIKNKEKNFGWITTITPENKVEVGENRYIKMQNEEIIVLLNILAMRLRQEL